jgi:hypothetical protein
MTSVIHKPPAPNAVPTRNYLTIQSNGTPNHKQPIDTLSMRSKAPSNIDKDLIGKFDDKRKAKYHLLRDLQMHDQGK